MCKVYIIYCIQNKRTAFAGKDKTMNYQIEDKNMHQMGDHSLKMDNRHMLAITGVTDVDGFDEHTIVLVTVCGIMTVHGNELRINKLNIEAGDISIEGEISAIQYSNQSTARGKESWISKVFK